MPSRPCVFVSCPVMTLYNNTLIPVMQDSYRDSPALGVYLLVAHLRRKGYQCDVFDWVAAPHISLEEVIQELLHYEVIFFSANSLNWAVIRTLAKKVKENNPGIKTCIGGPHATYYPQSVMVSECFDGLFRGEADNYIHLVYETLRSGETLKPGKENTIPGFSLCKGSVKNGTGVKNGAGIKNDIGVKNGAGAKNGTIPQVVQEHDLTTFDWHPAYDLIPASQYCTMPVETSRGCRNSCTFCSIIGKNSWRSYSAKVALEQLVHALPYCEKTRFKKLNIVDNTFTTDHRRIIDICKALSEDSFRHRLTYDAALVDLQDLELIEALEPFTSDLLVGAEVSSEGEAKKIHKAVSPELIKQAALHLQKFNLSQRAVFSFIIGFPWHTTEDCLRTFDFITNLILDYGVRVYLQWYWAIPGSAIWSKLEQERKISLEVVNTPGFFQSSEWFYAIRNMRPEDVWAVDERIRPVQMLLTLGHGSQVRRPFEYAPPFVRS
ncbi:MAG: cobalamin-dependent protein [bacterium]